MKPPKAPVRRESVDERETSAEWRRLGYVEIKIMKASRNGWPDRYYTSKALGVRFWCEWKAEGREPDWEQALRHDELREQGDIVIVAHSRREFWEKVRELQAGNHF